MIRTHILSLLVLLSGCDRCSEPEEPIGTSDEAGGRTGGVIEGTVRLARGAELPLWADNPMVEPEPRPPLPDTCTPPQEADRRPVRLGRGRGLAGVMVTLGDFQRNIPHEPVTHELFIRDCRLEPRIIVATREDHLRITNETPDYHFMPDVGIPPLTALMSGNSRDLDLGRGGVRTLRCGFLAPCGRAEIVVLYHPLHAVTDENGRYRIEGVPAGDEVRIAAWHPLFAEAGETLTLEVGERRHLDLTLTPAPAQTPTPPPPPRPGRAEDNPDVLF